MNKDKLREEWKNNKLKVAINDYGNETSITTTKYIKQSIDEEERDKQWLESAMKLYDWITSNFISKEEVEGLKIINRFDTHLGYNGGYGDAVDEINQKINSLLKK